MPDNSLHECATDYERGLLIDMAAAIEPRLFEYLAGIAMKLPVKKFTRAGNIIIFETFEHGTFEVIVRKT